jgi:hypothetical protein
MEGKTIAMPVSLMFSSLPARVNIFLRALAEMHESEMETLRGRRATFRGAQAKLPTIRIRREAAANIISTMLGPTPFGVNGYW